MPYTLIDHTADFGIHICSADPEALFADAANVLFEQITDTRLLNGERSIQLTIAGKDWPDLMVNWLRELLYLWNGKDVLVHRVEILNVSQKQLEGVAFVDQFNPEKHVIVGEIKAVTYHQISVFPTHSGWEATIIFDV